MRLPVESALSVAGAPAAGSPADATRGRATWPSQPAATAATAVNVAAPSTSRRETDASFMATPPRGSASIRCPSGVERTDAGRSLPLTISSGWAGPVPGARRSRLAPPRTPPRRSRVKPPFKTILCPTDLSPTGNLAVPVAYLLATKGSVVHLMHVDAPPKTGNPLYPDEKPKGAPTEEQVKAARAATKQKLEALVPADSATRGVTTQVDLVEGE